MIDDEQDRQWWRDFINSLYLAICGVAICIVVAGMAGVICGYWGMK